MSDNRAHSTPERQDVPPSEFLSAGTSKNRCINLSSISADISVEAVTRYFGGSRYKADEATVERVGNGITAASTLVNPQAIYSLFAVSSVTGKEIILETGEHVNVPDCLEATEAKLVSVVIGTLGAELETHCRRLAAGGDIYLSTLYDAVGTALLDLLSERMSSYIEQTCTPYNLVNGPRFAPGIDGYPLEYQHQLFQLTDGTSIGVSLNSSAIMVPTKSISFFQTLATRGTKTRSSNKCHQCRLTGCQFRVTAADRIDR